MVVNRRKKEMDTRADRLAKLNQVLVQERKRCAEMEKQLASARQLVDDASRAKNDFIANISHELRTPMNAILGFTALLKMDPGQGEKSRQMLAHLDNAGAKLLRLIDDLLNLSRLEHGTFEIVPAPFSLDALCREVLASQQAKADARGLGLKYAPCKKAIDYLSGDAGCIRQVLQNLLDNAIKFTHEGEVLLAVECMAMAGASVRLRFIVRDTGMGIPAEFHQRLFERFSRLDHSISRKYGGMGIGLAICRHIINIMGGDIELSSHSGQGSEFRVDLPLRVAVRPDRLQSERFSEGEDMEKSRVLLVEDNRLNQITLKAMVEEAGCHVDVAGTGREALEKLQQPYDLVLMDISMPDMDGYQTTAEIRRLFAQRERIPVVALTAHAMNGERERCIAAGMDDYLSKPVQMADLHATIRRWISNQSTETGEDAD